VVDFEPINGKLKYEGIDDIEDLEDESDFSGNDQSGITDMDDIPF
jgi:hypothetical protein